MASTYDNPVILWFRQDLRIGDNLALRAASETGAPIIPIYILDTNQPRPIGAAGKWWLYKSLTALNASLDNKLSLFKGDPAVIISEIIQKTKANRLFYNVCYEPYDRERDSRINKELLNIGINVSCYESSLLLPIEKNVKSDGTPYKVFTSFYKNVILSNPIDLPVAAPESLKLKIYENSLPIEKLGLQDKHHWASKFEPLWNPGEQGAAYRLDQFLSSKILEYKIGRDYPALDNTSRLSPHLHYGEISPRQIWYKVKNLSNNKQEFINTDFYLRELIWREFAYNLLYHNPELPYKNLQSQFDKFPWRDNKKDLTAWQKGMTGYPIVDAGMRELWSTGYMHNRVRMIAASFLVKHLLIDWRYGEEWFWDTLLDADLANNCAGWQWVAGSGVDAAPYYRIFNPIIQGQKFDPEGNYTTKFVPELSNLPKQYLFKPYDTPPLILRHCNVKPNITYPIPIVEHNFARDRALEALRKTKEP